MKKSFLFIIVFFVVASSTLWAQQKPITVDPNKADEQLTKEEGDVRIKDLKDNVSGLETQLKQTNEKLEKFRQDLPKIQQQLTDCENALYALIGASKEDVEKFRQRIGVLEGKVREMKTLTDDQLADRQDQVKTLEAELNALRKEKIAALPEFYPRMLTLGKDIKSLYREKKVKTYTVGTWSENRECLWNIAGRQEIYSDPFLWPKIWVANKDIVRNPDIIFPGQELQIPPKAEKTDDELKAERRYWRVKHTTMNQKGETQAPLKTSANN